MPSSQFDITCRFALSYKSIADYAKDVVNVLVNLGKIESAVLTPVFATTRFSQPIEIEHDDLDAASELVAQCILRVFQGAIKRHSGVKKPTLETKHAIGHPIMFQIKNGRKNLFAVRFTLGGEFPHFKLEWFARDFERDADWFHNILETIVVGDNSYTPTYVNVRPLSNIASTHIVKKKVMAHLGWMTYVADNFNVPIPSTLPHYTVEPFAKGRLMTLTPENVINADPAEHAKYVNQISEAMDYVLAHEPDYHVNLKKLDERYSEFRKKYPTYTIPGYNLDSQGKLVN